MFTNIGKKYVGKNKHYYYSTVRYYSKRIIIVIIINQSKTTYIDIHAWNEKICITIVYKIVHCYRKNEDCLSKIKHFIVKIKILHYDYKIVLFYCNTLHCYGNYVHYFLKVRSIIINVRIYIAKLLRTSRPVSYTHLDVYKRQQ